jgi:hypothetical protein
MSAHQVKQEHRSSICMAEYIEIMQSLQYLFSPFVFCLSVSVILVKMWRECCQVSWRGREDCETPVLCLAI